MTQIHLFVAVLLGIGMIAVAADRPASAHGHLLSQFVADRTGDIPDPPPGKVALRLSSTYLPKPLPGAGIETYESLPHLDRLWAMQSLPRGEPFPAGQRIKDDVIVLAPGEARKVTIVYRNPSSSVVGFVVLPHLDSAFGLASHVWLTCMCMSDVYEAPPGGVWYRVISVKVSPAIPPGSKVDSLHTVLTDPAVFPERTQHRHGSHMEDM